MTTTITPSNRYRSAVALRSHAEALSWLLQNAYDAIVAAEGLARISLLSEADGYIGDDDLGHALKVLANEFRMVDKEDLTGPIRAVESVCDVLRAQEEEAEAALEGGGVGDDG